MSVANALNLAIAVVEKRPETVRSISRNLPLTESRGIATATCRLEQAVERRQDEAVLNALLEIQRYSMVIDLDSTWNSDRTDDFLAGVAYLEEFMDAKISTLKIALKLDKDDQ